MLLIYVVVCSAGNHINLSSRWNAKTPEIQEYNMCDSRRYLLSDCSDLRYSGMYAIIAIIWISFAEIYNLLVETVSMCLWISQIYFYIIFNQPTLSCLSVLNTDVTLACFQVAMLTQNQIKLYNSCITRIYQ